MDQDQDFSQLRSLLALKRHDLPQDTQVDQFLTEFHHRQRAQLLVPESLFSRATAWVKERLAGFELVPSLSYASAVAAIAITAFVGLSQQVQVTQSAEHPYQLSFRLQSHENALAMLPGSLGTSSVVTKPAENLQFASNHSDSATTRFVLASNTPAAYDSTVAF